MKEFRIISRVINDKVQYAVEQYDSINKCWDRCGLYHKTLKNAEHVFNLYVEHHCKVIKSIEVKE